MLLYIIFLKVLRFNYNVYLLRVKCFIDMSEFLVIKNKL